MSIIGSLAVYVAIMDVGTTIFPGRGRLRPLPVFELREADGAGVAVASLVRPIVTLFSLRTRRLFAWLTVVVTLGGLARDAWILYWGAVGADQASAAVGKLSDVLPDRLGGWTSTRHPPGDAAAVLRDGDPAG